jgi:hypothetical protein
MCPACQVVRGRFTGRRSRKPDAGAEEKSGGGVRVVGREQSQGFSDAAGRLAGGRLVPAHDGAGIPPGVYVVRAVVGGDWTLSQPLTLVRFAEVAQSMPATRALTARPGGLRVAAHGYARACPFV